ncbi:MAG: hypothetical protein M0017_02895 [Desulfobacteraceae bacterium]|nr:hypothetical protein [Desulfobacteraceae bacterium]
MSWRNPFRTLALLTLILLAACARMPAGVGIPAAEQEKAAASFREWLAAQSACPCCFDAAATVTFKSWIQSGTLTGFAQAKEPAHLKLVALNPFGQPEVMLVTDGRDFQLVSVPESKVYEGSVRAKAFAKYAPAGVRPEHAFFWLTGKMPPGEWRIVRAARDEKAAGYWLDLVGQDPELRHRVLFSPHEGVIRRHLVLDDRERPLVDVRYEEFAPALKSGSCKWPGRIIVETRAHRGQLIISLSDWLTAPLADKDFRLELPSGFERRHVE